MKKEFSDNQLTFGGNNKGSVKSLNLNNENIEDANDKEVKDTKKEKLSSHLENS